MMATEIKLPEIFTPEVVALVGGRIAIAKATGERTTAWEEIEDILVAHKMGRKNVRMPPEFVGVHPENRSRFGVGGSDAQVHLKELLVEGFSFKKSADATAVETPPPPHDVACKKFNDDLEATSRGLIPPVFELKLNSCGASHTNVGCRRVKAGVRSIVPELADENGNFDYAKLTLNRPSFKDALDNGMCWFVLHWACPFAWPDLLSLIEKTLNTDARGGQGEVEMMLHLQAQRVRALRAGEDANWKKICDDAKTSLPKCAPYMHI